MIRRIAISLSVLILAVSCGALVLLNWSATGFKALTVASGSMRPTIPVGSLVLMHRVPLSTLKVGDVITYTNLNKRGTTITHRIVKAYKINGNVPAFVTKGDANSVADPVVVGGLVKGKTVWHAPKLGAWLNRVDKPYFILPVVYLAALSIMIQEIKRLSEYYKKEVPYRVVGFERPKEPKAPKAQVLATTVNAMKLAGVLVIISGFMAVPVKALMSTNTVSLVHNSITVAPPPSQCSTNGSNTNVTVTGSGGNNNVNVNSTTNQNSSTGNASTPGGGNATSGNASNTSCTNISVTITNH